MATDLDMAYPFVVMRLKGEIHLLEDTLATAETNLPGLKAQIAATTEEITFLRERISELYGAIAALED